MFPRDSEGLGKNLTTVRGSNFNDTLRGSDTTATTEVFEGWAGDDLIDGRGGFDRVRYDNSFLTGTGVDLTSGVSISLASGIVSGRDDLAKLAYGTDTLRSIESVRGTNAGDVYDATGYGLSGALNVGSNGNYNEFEGMGGADLITGNGNTRLLFGTALAAVTVDLAAGTARSTVADNAGIGVDTITGGVGSVAGTRFNDAFTGGNANETFFGNGGDDTITGGAGIDTAVFNGPRSRYTITFDQSTAGTATIEDTLGGGDGKDSLVGVELIEFADQIVMNGRVMDLNNVSMTGGKTLFGGNQNNDGLGNDLTIGINASGRLIDLLGGGTDVLRLGQAGASYSLNIQNVEQVVSVGTGNDFLSLFKPVNATTAPSGLLVDLGAGVDSLSLANGGNDLSVTNVENIHGGAGQDTVRLTGTVGANVTVNNVETVIGTAQSDQITIAADAGVTFASASLDLGTGNDTVSVSIGGVNTSASLALTGVETLNAFGLTSLNLQNAANGLSINGLGGLTLNLAAGNNVVTLSNVAAVNASAGGNDTINLNSMGPAAIGLNLGTGTDVVNLVGTNGFFNLALTGGPNVSVFGQTAGQNETVTLMTPQFGTIFDLGAGSDTLNLASGGNNVSVANIETVHGGLGPDAVHLTDTGAATALGINDIETLIGTAQSDQVTIGADVGVSTVGATLDLGAGADTVSLNFFGASTVANLALTNVETLTSAGGVGTVNLQNAANNLYIDLGTGFHTLNLGPGDNTVTVANVFNLNAAGSGNTTVTFDPGAAVNQIVDLGFGNDVLNLTGGHDQLSMSIAGSSTLTVNDQTATGSLNLTLMNTQAGTTFDFGAGSNDTLHLFTDPHGFTSTVSVRNIETVIGSNNSDTIRVLGNDSNPTTVIAGSGADFLTAGSGDDHFRFTSITDSASGPGRDQITGFDAAHDIFEFVGIGGGTGSSQQVHFIGNGSVAPAQGSEAHFDQSGPEARLANLGGITVLQIDVNGDGAVDVNDMEVQLNLLAGPPH